MATAYTSLLGLALPVQGELQGTWGDTVNNSITSLLDTAVAGTTTLSTDADVTLTTTTGATNQARQAIILWTASGTTTRYITAPAQSKIYTVINKTGSTQSIVLRGVGPTTGVTIPAGASGTFAWNGADFVDVSNYINGNLVINGTVTLSGGTANGVLYLNGSKVATSGSALVFDGTSLGIGTSAPAFKLSVQGNATLGGANPYLAFNGDASSASTPTYIQRNGTSGLQTFYNTGTGTNGAMAFVIGGGSEAVRVTSAGDVGIGTPTPSYKLDVSGGNIRALNTTATAQFLAQNNGNTVSIGLDNSTGGNFGTAYSANIWVQGAYPLKFWTSDTQRMILDASGNLGVGTASPASKLHVASAGGVSARVENTFNTGAAYFTAKNTAGSTILGQDNIGGYLQTDYSAPLVFYTNNTEKMRLDAGGNLGIGTNNPINILDINSSSPRVRVVAATGTNNNLLQLVNSGGTAYIGLDNSTGSSLTAPYALNLYHTGAYPITFTTNNAERARITSTGEFLVNATSNGGSNLALFYGSGGTAIRVGSSDNAQYRGYEIGATSGDGNSYASFMAELSGGRLRIRSGYAGFGGFTTFETNGSERMRITSTGLVGIGTSSPIGLLDVKGGSIWVSNSSNDTALIMSSSSTEATIQASYNTTGAYTPITFRTSEVEKMRILTSAAGNGVLIGATTSMSGGGSDNINGFGVQNCTTNAVYMVLQNKNDANIYLAKNTGYTSTQFIYFYVVGSQVGSISTNGTTTSYNTSSDYRMKTLVGAVVGAGERIDALNPVEFDWKINGKRARGFFADQFQQVYPDSVSGQKDEVDKEGKPVYQAMQAGTSEVIADLVSEIQSLRKRLAAAGIA